jgi:hypothetical protein
LAKRRVLGAGVHKTLRQAQIIHDLFRRRLNVGTSYHTVFMGRELPHTLRNLARNQAGVVSRSQAIRAGLTSDMIKFRLVSDQWQPLHRGVYATFTGIPGRAAHLWAAVLSAGPGAALSHETAAEVHRLTDNSTHLIHVTVPVQRRVVTTDGVRVLRLHGWDGRLRPCSPVCPAEMVLAEQVR